jgi:hypothetical protein
MSNRCLSDFAKADPEVPDLLNVLIGDSSPSVYGDAMNQLGHHLALAMTGRDLVGVNGSKKDICVVCTVEDADFLAKGVLSGLEENGVAPSRLHLYCIWNDKIRQDGVSLSPIKKRYAEEFDVTNVIFVVVKSVISGACVVKTNLTRVLTNSRDADVVVAAPVLLRGAQARLASEFPSPVSDRFKYVWFAEDSDREGDVVVPGIGGAVYERLGLSGSDGFTPKIVKQRRKEHFCTAG